MYGSGCSQRGSQTASYPVRQQGGAAHGRRVVRPWPTGPPSPVAVTLPTTCPSGSGPPGTRPRYRPSAAVRAAPQHVMAAHPLPALPLPFPRRRARRPSIQRPWTRRKWTACSPARRHGAAPSAELLRRRPSLDRTGGGPFHTQPGECGRHDPIRGRRVTRDDLHHGPHNRRHPQPRTGGRGRSGGPHPDEGPSGWRRRGGIPVERGKGAHRRTVATPYGQRHPGGHGQCIRRQRQPAPRPHTLAPGTEGMRSHTAACPDSPTATSGTVFSAVRSGQRRQ